VNITATKRARHAIAGTAAIAGENSPYHQRSGTWSGNGLWEVFPAKSPSHQRNGKRPFRTSGPKSDQALSEQNLWLASNKHNSTSREQALHAGWQKVVNGQREAPGWMLAVPAIANWVAEIERRADSI